MVAVNKVKELKEVLALCGTIFVLGLLALPLYKNGISPDATSYVTIAEKYSNADFRHAINGYWGPLFSWLLAPAFWIGADPLFFGRIILIATASLIAGLVYKILRVSTSARVALFGAGFAGLMALSWALHGPLTPDLPFVLALLIVVLAGTRFLSKPNTASAVLFGLSGGALYFTKPAGFYLFLAGWLACVLYLSNMGKKLGRALAKTWPALATFLLLAVPFITVLALKYERVVVTTSSAYNLAMAGPQSAGHPINNEIIAPPNLTAISAWEDISNAPVTEWNPLASTEDISHLLSNMGRNLERLGSTLWKFSFPLLILAIYGFYSLSKNSRQKEEKFLLAIFGFSLALIYLPTFVEPRYMIFLQIVAIIGFCWFVGLFLKINRYYAVLWFVAVSAVLISVYWQFDVLVAKSRAGDVIRSDANSLKQVLTPNDRVVSDRVDGIYACYYTSSKCWGVVVPSERSNSDLALNEVDYLLLTDSTAGKLKNYGVKLTPIEVVSYLDQKLYRFNP